MGQGLSCSMNHENDVFSSAVRSGETEIVRYFLQGDPNLLLRGTFFDRHSALHLAALNGHLEIVSILLDRSMNPNTLNSYKQIPLMLAAMRGRISCVESHLRSAIYSLPSSSSLDGGRVDDAISEEASEAENKICCICFDQACTIEIQDCIHRVCAQCTLALCCHSKPNQKTLCLTALLCPFCRSSIARLVVAKIKSCDDGDCIAAEI